MEPVTFQTQDDHATQIVGNEGFLGHAVSSKFTRPISVGYHITKDTNKESYISVPVPFRQDRTIHIKSISKHSKHKYFLCKDKKLYPESLVSLYLYYYTQYRLLPR